MEHCADHEARVKDGACMSQELALLRQDMSYVRRDLELVVGRLSAHVIESEKEGGRHERLAKAEVAIISLEEAIKHDREMIEQRVSKECDAINVQLRNDRIMGRWFMIGSGVMSGVVVAGGLELVKTIVGVLR